GILLLQQRQKVEAELRHYQNTLEDMVTARTEALAESNTKLMREIAEREAAEQRIRQYSQIVEKMDVGMYVVQAADLNDEDSLQIVAANPAALRYSEKTFDEVVGKPMTAVLNSVKEKGFPQRYLQVMKTGHPAHLEDHYFNPDGSLREAYAIKVFRLTPDSVGVLFENVTEQKLAEERLHQFNAELEARVEERTAQLAAANRELESFSYSVSHDLRAPLRSISGFARILLDDFAQDIPSEARGYLRRIHDGAQQMGRLIDDLLAFSRLGRQDLKKSTVDMFAVAREVCDSLAEEYAGRQVRIVLGLLPPAHADYGLITRVYANLIGNAIKYTRHREMAEIEIGCLHKHGTSIYYVKDNGAGFNMKYADKLFGVFQRLHRQDEFEGTGVGLATVKRIITKHGGEIWAEAEEDKGATFYFTLGKG
ncbi:MAG: ATP-binding protein, partial [Anaerolineales bacterium]